MILKTIRIIGWILVLYLPVLSGYLSPQTWFVFELISLSFPVYFSLVFIVGIYKYLKKNIDIKYALLLLPYLFFLNDFYLLPQKGKEGKQCITITSCNVKSFNYHELVGKKGRMKGTVASIESVADLQGDIVCLQEFYRFPTGNAKAVDTFFRHPFIIDAKQIVENRPGAPIKKYAGLAILSEYEPISHGVLQDTFRVYAVYADIKAGDAVLRLYNCHLLSYILHDEEKYGWKGVPKVINARYKQIDALLKHASSSEYPVIIAGDMNEAQFTYAYRLFTEQYKSAFREAGSGLRFTYKSILPFYQIDHFFLDERIEVEEAEIRRDFKKSDHFPVSACITLNN